MMTLSGTVTFGKVFGVTEGGKPLPDAKKKPMISFLVADEIGNKYACQMWGDDQQFSWLAQVIESATYQLVQLEVKSLVSRLRKFPDGKEQPQTNFVVRNVQFPNLQRQSGASPQVQQRVS